VFIVHGGQKLFEMGPGGTAGMLQQMGVPMASVVGPILSIVEPLAGVCVLLGLLTRIASLAIAADMLGAMLVFHIHHGFFVPMGVEFVMVNCAIGIALAMLGAGRYSLDDVIAQRRGEP
jgi:putative oxidoreductase